MAKKKTRAGVSQTRNRREIQIEHTEDDNILPDIDDLERLEKIRPGTIDWFFERAANEQDHRHRKEMKSIESIDRTNTGVVRTNFLGITYAFFLMVGGMVFSYLLIINDHETIGGIFASGVLLSICGMFLSKVKSNNNERTRIKK